ncbi:MAG: dockerin type I repeat-containing protein, partial [Clostridia bacterium]|nr:dockerin type I repeat-containing protein [Clostridia bacterium]
CTVRVVCGHLHSTHYDRIAPTCTEEGWEAYSYCQDCKEVFEGADEPIPATGHVVEQWLGNGDHHSGVCGTCRKSVSAPHCGGTATCTAKAVCEVCGQPYSEVDPDAHYWGEATYVWAEDNTSVTATRSCKHDPTHIETETVTATSEVTTAATCEAKGKTTYTATFTNAAFQTQTKTLENIDALDHDWNEATYVWAEDNTSVTATRSCKHDPTHIETETVTAAGEVTNPAGCETMGDTTYISSAFTNPAFAVQSETVTNVPATGHLHTVSFEAAPSTCTVQGHGAYTVCSDCGNVIAGSDALLPLAVHTWSKVVEARFLESDATCISKAVYYKSCSVCGAINADETFTFGNIDPNCHIGEKTVVSAVPSTCTVQGHGAYTVCDDCGKIIEGSDELLPFAPHTGGTATLTSRPVCENCGQEYGEALQFLYGDANEDGAINMADLIRLANVLADPAVAHGPGADVNADGALDQADLELLRTYFARYDYANNVSRVKLGKEA